MEIAEKLYLTDPKILFELVVLFELRAIGAMYFRGDVLDDGGPIKRLMMPSAYSGRYERHNGVITQPHRLVLK